MERLAYVRARCEEVRKRALAVLKTSRELRDRLSNRQAG
jgi:hypothetical protein